jgi:hypothetical protein
MTPIAQKTQSKRFGSDCRPGYLPGTKTEPRLSPSANL